VNRTLFCTVLICFCGCAFHVGYENPLPNSPPIRQADQLPVTLDKRLAGFTEFYENNVGDTLRADVGKLFSQKFTGNDSGLLLSYQYSSLGFRSSLLGIDADYKITVTMDTNGSALPLSGYGHAREPHMDKAAQVATEKAVYDLYLQVQAVIKNRQGKD